jgi:hypothetical protein
VIRTFKVKGIRARAEGNQGARFDTVGREGGLGSENFGRVCVRKNCSSGGVHEGVGSNLRGSSNL